MQIDISTKSLVFSKQNNACKNNVSNMLQNMIQNQLETKIKNKEKIETNNINKNLNTTTHHTGLSVSDIVDAIDYLYAPITDTFKSISLNSKLYNQYSDELKNNNLSEDEKDKIQSALDNAKQNIIELTSPEYTSKLDKYISNNVSPQIKDLLNRLNKATGNTIDTSELSIPSMESLGLIPNKNLDFNSLLAEIKDAEKSIKKKISKLFDIDIKYGGASKSLAKIIDTYE